MIEDTIIFLQKDRFSCDLHHHHHLSLCILIPRILDTCVMLQNLFYTTYNHWDMIVFSTAPHPSDTISSSPHSDGLIIYYLLKLFQATTQAIQRSFYWSTYFLP